ncbi:hypothetical protein T492DRAFT_927076 [Pavlovales sp. CCMP2436]|nr:hypothetical protein T492DRAFT_927076 [Pavlovales sp. CCMP2436]
MDGATSPSGMCFSCAFAGCGPPPPHPDAARKHARRHHAEWVATRDADKHPCHVVVAGDDGILTGLSLSRQVSANGYDQVSLLRAAAASASGVRSPSDEVDGRVPFSLVELPFGAFSKHSTAVAYKSDSRGGEEPDAWGTPPTQCAPHSPHAFQLLVAAAIQASDYESSSGEQSPRDNVSEDHDELMLEPMVC